MNESSSFQEFVKRQHINPSVYENSVPFRFFRTNPRIKVSWETLRTAFPNVEQTPVPNVYRLPEGEKLASSDLFKQHHIYGIDLPSVVCVLALDISATDHVLDLCCAPGGKLFLCADVMNTAADNLSLPLQERGSVSGVDIIEHRLHTCRSQMMKYSVMRTRLYLADGTTFNVSPPTTIYDNKIIGLLPSTSKSNKRGKKRKIVTPSDMKCDATADDRLYDKVLVDAECSHDGSLRHIMKAGSEGLEKYASAFLSESKLARLCDLQLKLLENGFRQVKRGGTLIYSTCSLTRAQNEEIVTKFLSKYKKQAQLVPIDLPFLTKQRTRTSDLLVASTTSSDGILESSEVKHVNDKDVFASDKLVVAAGFLPEVVRFGPNSTRTNGLFIAKILKNPSVG